MSKSILYYPTIEFQPEDYRWLWNAALFWDKIYRIVPPGYELNEPHNIRELCSTGEIGIAISPENYAKQASDEFAEFMDKNKHKAAALALIEDDETEYIRIHTSKLDVRLQKEIFYKAKTISEDENWLYANPNTVNFYMTFLANHIASKNSLSLYTRNQELWTTSTYFLYDGTIQDMYVKDDTIACTQSAEALISLMIPEIFPQNLLDVPPGEILRFREKRKDERAQFLAAIERFRNELSKADAPEVLLEVVNDEKDAIKKAVREYKKSMDILKAARFGGVLTTVLSLSADAMGYINDIPEIVKGIAGSSAVWLGVLTGITQKFSIKNKNPYTYLAHIKSSFSFFPDSSRMFAGKPFWEKYNYTLSRGFEEFVND